MKDVHWTEKWEKGSSNNNNGHSRPKHVGNEVHLEWKDDTRTTLFVPISDRSHHEKVK